VNSRDFRAHPTNGHRASRPAHPSNQARAENRIAKLLVSSGLHIDQRAQKPVAIVSDHLAKNFILEYRRNIRITE